MATKLQHEVCDIICHNRPCGKCKLYEEKEQRSLTKCADVPLNVQVGYAQLLMVSGDRNIIETMEIYWEKESHIDAIKVICSGGVQYD